MNSKNIDEISQEQQVAEGTQETNETGAIEKVFNENNRQFHLVASPFLTKQCLGFMKDHGFRKRTDFLNMALKAYIKKDPIVS